MHMHCLFYSYFLFDTFVILLLDYISIFLYLGRRVNMKKYAILRKNVAKSI